MPTESTCAGASSGAALVTDLRLVAAKPRKAALAIFDGATFNKTKLLPMPDQTNSFIATSISPRQLVELIKQMAPSSAVKEQIDDMAEKVQNHGYDLEKDLLAHLGPRIVAYLATGRSAATNDDSLEKSLKNGWNPLAMITAMQSAFPKLTVVAEVKNHEAFSKALDAVVVAINEELKVLTDEKADEQRKEAEEKKAAGAGPARAGGARSGGGSDRAKSQRPRSTPGPRLTMTPTAGKARLYILTTPSASPLHLGPSSFRPTIELDANYVVFAVSPEAARNALAAVRKEDWKPSGNLTKVCENAPDNLVLLGVNDIGETLPPLLESLPGTLQTMINTSLALAKGKSPADAAGKAPGSPAGGPAGNAPPGGRRGGLGLAGAGMAPGQGRPGVGFGPPPGGRGNPTGPGNSNGSGAADEAGIVFNIEAEKLPKASDLKSFLFPTTVAVSVTDQDVRVVLRQAFPDLASLVGTMPLAAMMPRVAEAITQFLKRTEASQTAPAAGATAKESPKAAPAAGPASKGAPPGGRRGGAAPRPR